MHRVDTSSAAPALPASDAAGAPGFFTKGDPIVPTPATVPGQDWFNAVQEELIAVVVEGGLVPDVTKANFTQLRDAILAIAAPALPPQHVSGLELSNNGTVGIDVKAGAARDDGNTADMVLAAALANKQLNVVWAVGPAAGMLDAGAIALNSTYQVFLIQRSDTGVVDLLASLSPTAPTMPPGYDRKAWIGALRTDGVPSIEPFLQDGNDFTWKTLTQDYRQSNASLAAVIRQIRVPSGIAVTARHIATFETPDTIVGESLVTSIEQTNSVPGPTNFTHRLSNGGGGNSVMMEIKTNTLRQIRTRNSATAAFIFSSGTTVGWIAPRGRKW